MNAIPRGFTPPTTPLQLYGAVDPLIGRVLASASSMRAVHPAFQPIVDLSTGAVVGAEALARWPDAPGVDPPAVFEQARTQDCIHILDQACRNAAVRAFTAHGHLDDGLTVFVNAEPDALVHHLRTQEVFTVPIGTARVILELTERALLSDPARLLNVVIEARAQGLGIALDDVGKHPDSLTLLSLIAPDVVKLDGSLVAGAPSYAQLQVISAVNAYAEATGATILAEGIETGEHRRRALDIGATLGQGWLLGRPAALPPTPWPPLRREDRVPIDHGIFDTSDRPSNLLPDCPREAEKLVLLRYSKYLERQALASSEPVTVLGSFQHAAYFTDAARFADLAARHPLVAAIGVDMASSPAPGVRGTAISSNHALAEEWTVVVVGQYFFAALIARDLHTADEDEQSTPERHRRFAYALTYDRAAVTAAGRALLRHMHREPEVPGRESP